MVATHTVTANDVSRWAVDAVQVRAESSIIRGEVCKLVGLYTHLLCLNMWSVVKASLWEGVDSSRL